MSNSCMQQPDSYNNMKPGLKVIRHNSMRRSVLEHFSNRSGPGHAGSCIIQASRWCAVARGTEPEGPQTLNPKPCLCTEFVFYRDALCAMS
eukprot:352393-Chlamydomonas_euryale.AAC.5